MQRLAVPGATGHDTQANTAEAWSFAATLSGMVSFSNSLNFFAKFASARKALAEAQSVFSPKRLQTHSITVATIGGGVWKLRNSCKSLL